MNKPMYCILTSEVRDISHFHNLMGEISSRLTQVIKISYEKFRKSYAIALVPMEADVKYLVNCFLVTGNTNNSYLVEPNSGQMYDHSQFTEIPIASMFVNTTYPVNNSPYIHPMYSGYTDCIFANAKNDGAIIEYKHSRNAPLVVSRPPYGDLRGVEPSDLHKFKIIEDQDVFGEAKTAIETLIKGFDDKQLAEIQTIVQRELLNRTFATPQPAPKADLIAGEQYFALYNESIHNSAYNDYILKDKMSEQLQERQELKQAINESYSNTLKRVEPDAWNDALKDQDKLYE